MKLGAEVSETQLLAFIRIFELIRIRELVLNFSKELDVNMRCHTSPSDCVTDTFNELTGSVR